MKLAPIVGRDEATLYERVSVRRSREMAQDPDFEQREMVSPSLKPKFEEGLIGSMASQKQKGACQRQGGQRLVGWKGASGEMDRLASL